MGSIGSVCSAFSVGSFQSLGSAFSARSVGSLFSYAADGESFGQPVTPREKAVATAALGALLAALVIRRRGV